MQCLLGENGILNKAKLAKENSDTASIEEQNKLETYNLAIDNYTTTSRGYNVTDYTENLLYKCETQNLKNGENGVTFTNASEITTDASNKCIKFSGSSGITISGNTVDPTSYLLGTSTKTIMVWYRTNTMSTENSIFNLGNPYNVGGGAIIEFLNGYIRLGTGGASLIKDINPFDMIDNTWHLAVGVLENGNKSTFYYDAIGFQATGSYSTNNSDVQLGMVSSTRYYTGDIGEVRIYKSALSRENVRQIYEYGRKVIGY